MLISSFNLNSIKRFRSRFPLISLLRPLSNVEFNLKSGSEMMSKHMEPVLISIEGNIGAGKSTLLKRLRNSHPEWTFIDEPLDVWSSIQNEQGESILEVFYKDRKRWSYTFQNCALLTRHQNIEASIKKMEDLRILINSNPTKGKHIFLTERCLDTDYHVFTKMLKAEGSIDKLEYILYEKLLDQLKKAATPLAAIVYVNTPPDICEERIKLRSRSGENAISLDYLIKLNSYQSYWMENTNLPIITTDLKNIPDVEMFIQNLEK